MTRSFLSLLAFTVSLAFAGLASAGDVTYEMRAAGVVCGGTKAHAEMAVREAGPVKSVTADPDSHSLRATFDEEEMTLAAIVESLEASGINVSDPVKVQ